MDSQLKRMAEQRYSGTISRIRPFCVQKTPNAAAKTINCEVLRLYVCLDPGTTITLNTCGEHRFEGFVRSTAARIRIQIDQKLLFAWCSVMASARKFPNRSLFKLSKIRPICDEFLTVNRLIVPVKCWPNLANVTFRRAFAQGRPTACSITA